MKIIRTMLFLCILLVPFCASAVVLNFDDLALGDYRDNFRYNDVIIQTYPGAHLQVTDQTADGYGNARSLPNKLSVWGDQPLVPKEKTSFLFLFDAPVADFSFWLTGVGHDTTVNAYDSAGNIIETYIQTYPTIGPPPSGYAGWDYYYDGVLRLVELQQSGISRVSIQPLAYDGFSIDDVSYNVVPEPASLLLLSFSLLGAGFFKRKFRK